MIGVMVMAGGLTAVRNVRPVNDFARRERSKLETLTELRSRTIQWVGTVLATPAPRETKVAEADALVRHYRELKDEMRERGPSSSDAKKERG